MTVYHALGLGLSAWLLNTYWPVGGWLDQALSLPWLGPDGQFIYRNQWLVSHIGHDGLKWLVNVLGLVWLVQWLGSYRVADWRAYRWFAGYPLLALLLSVAVVGLLKKFSLHACPWDLVVVNNGQISWLGPESPAGKCFPGGHASAGFGLLGVYFAYRQAQPQPARVFLLLVLGLGSLMGSIQVVRGAHFVSHNLWTLWYCWLINALLYPFICYYVRRIR